MIPSFVSSVRRGGRARLVKPEDALVFMLRRYPASGDVTVTRAMKMLYLADWRHAIVHEEQMSTARWRIGQWGPDSDEAHSAIYRSDRFVLERRPSPFGSLRTVISCRADVGAAMPPKGRDVATFVIEKAHRLTERGIRDLVVGTYPMRTGARNVPLDLVAGAAAYANERAALADE